MRRVGVTMDVDGALDAANRGRVLNAALIGAADFIRLDVTGLSCGVFAHGYSRFLIQLIGYLLDALTPSPMCVN